MAAEAEPAAPLGRRLESPGPQQRVPTTLSTIAVQSGSTRIVIALLQSREWVELKVLEMSPDLTQLGHSLEEAQLLQKQHDEVLQKLASKQSPVEELLNQADQLIASQKPKAEVYSAMAESLGLAWRDLNAQLETRRQMLQHSVAFHSRSRSFSDSMDLAERVFSDVRLPCDSEEAQAAIKQLTDVKKAMLEASMLTLQEGNQLLEQLRQLALRGTIDSRPNQIRATVQSACAQVERWLEELHDRRRCLEVLFGNRRTILDQCRTLCQLYADLGGVQKRAELVRRQLAAGCQLGDSAGAADLLLHEHSKLELEAKALQDRALSLLRTAEALVKAGTYARHEPATRAYAVLEICTQLMELTDRRRSLLTGAAQFFAQAHKACDQLDRMEEALRSAPTPEKPRVHAETAEELQRTAEPAVQLGNQLLDLAGRGADGTDGVSECLETLQRRLESLAQLCTAHKEESLRQTQLHNDFLEKYNMLFGWMVGEGEAFLRTHTNLGQTLEPATDFSELHQRMLQDVEARGRQMESLLDSVPELAERLEPETAADLQRKAEDMRAQWNSLHRLVGARLEVLRPYQQFHQQATRLQETLDDLRTTLDREGLTEDDIKMVEDKWLKMQQQYHHLANVGKAFVEVAQNCKDPYLDVRRACLCVDSILEHLRGDQVKVTEAYEHIQLTLTNARQFQTDWEACKRDSKQTLETTVSLLTELYPVLGEPGRPARQRGVQCQQAAQRLVPQLQRLRLELEQRSRAAEKLRDAGDTGGEADRLTQELTRQRDQITTITTEYQMTLQMMETYFKNVAELDSGIEKQRSLEQDVGLPDVPADCQHSLRELESTQRAFQELFRFAGTELERLEERVRQVEPAAAAEHDVKELKDALDTETTKWEETLSSRREQLERQATSTAFNSELNTINGQLAELSCQLATMKGQYGETRREAEQTSRAFRGFEDTISNTGRQIQNFVSTAQGFLSESPEPEQIMLELDTVQNKWSTFYQQVGDNRKLIDLSIEYFKLVEESEDWYKEGGKLLVDIARKSTQIRCPEEAQRLRTEINVFLSPGEQQQQERLRNITVMAEQLYGTPRPERVVTVTQQHRDMVESLTTVRQELQRLVEKLEQADAEREELRRHNDQLTVTVQAAQQEADAARAAASAADEARRAAEAAALALQEMPRPITPLVVPKVDVCTETVTQVTKVTVDSCTQDIPIGTSDASTQEVAVATTDASTQQVAVGTSDAATQEIPLTTDAATQEVAVNTADAATQQIPMGTSDASTQEISVGTSDASTQKVLFGTDVATQQVFIGTDASTQDVTLVADVSTQKVSSGTDAATQDMPVSTSDAATQKVSTGTDASTQKVTMGTDASTQDITLASDASTQKITMATDAATQKITMGTDAATQESGASVVDAGTEPFVPEVPDVPDGPQVEETVPMTRRPRSAQPPLPPPPAVPLVPPVFTTPLSDRTVQEGERHVLQACVAGEPAPTVFWCKDGIACDANSDYVLSRTEGGVCSLVIEETLVEDSATFTCRAENAAGTAETSGRLTVRELERGQPPVFSRQLRPDVRLEQGRPLLLHAAVSGTPTPQISWLHNGASVDGERRYLTTVNNGECTLRAEEALPQDQGVFICRAGNPLGFDQTSATVRVQPRVPYEKPQFSSPLSNVMARAGQKLRLECEVAGLPHPELIWLHNGRPVQEGRDTRVTFDGRRATLTIPEAFPKDAGDYVLVAKNEAGETTCGCHVSVKGRLPTETSDSEFASDVEPVKPCIQVQLRDLTVEQGERAQLDCVLTGQPEPEVIWYHDGRPVKESRDFQLLFHGDRCTLIINSARADDAGPYSVVAINSAGEASSQCSLNVLAPRTPTPEEVIEEPKFTKLLTDTIAKEDEQEVLEAEVTGLPAPTVTWLKDGREVKSTESMKLSLDGGRARLEIASCLPQHAGNYICVASNRGGEARCFAHVTVRGRPQPVQFRPPPPMEPPVFVQIFKDQHVAEGSDVLFQCIIDGKPKPTVQWLFDDASLPGNKFSTSSEGQHHMLRIRCSELAHCGRVKCIAENEIGKATCAAQLSVEEPVADLPLPTVSERLALAGNNGETSKSVALKKTMYTEVHEQTQIINGEKRAKPCDGNQESNQEVHSSIAVPPDQPLQRTTYEEVHRGDVAERVEKKPVAKPPRFISPLQGLMVKQGDTARLTGVYTGAPAPEVQWLRDGGPLPPAGAGRRLVTSHEPGRVTLTIDDVTDSDAGRYTCTMSNEAGTATSTADLVVKKTLFPPVFDHRLKAQVVQPGQRLFLEATVSGTPEPEVVWSRDGAPLGSQRCQTRQEESRHILVIDSVTKEDAGKYSIRATNAAGEATSIADLVVTDQVPLLVERRLTTQNLTEKEYKATLGQSSSVSVQPPAAVDSTPSVPPSGSCPPAQPAPAAAEMSRLQTRSVQQLQVCKEKKMTTGGVSVDLSAAGQPETPIAREAIPQPAAPPPAADQSTESKETQLARLSAITAIPEPPPARRSVSELRRLAEEKMREVETVQEKVTKTTVNREPKIPQLSPTPPPVVPPVGPAATPPGVSTSSTVHQTKSQTVQRTTETTLKTVPAKEPPKPAVPLTVPAPSQAPPGPAEATHQPVFSAVYGQTAGEATLSAEQLAPGKTAPAAAPAPQVHSGADLYRFPKPAPPQTPARQQPVTAPVPKPAPEPAPLTYVSHTWPAVHQQNPAPAPAPASVSSQTATTTTEQRVTSREERTSTVTDRRPQPGQRLNNIKRRIESQISEVETNGSTAELRGGVCVLPTRATEPDRPSPRPAAAPVPRPQSAAAAPFQPFPELEPFPYQPERPRPASARATRPPPTPTRFVPGRFGESDHESDYDERIPTRWQADGYEYIDRREIQVSLPAAAPRPADATKPPTPPSEFDKLPQIEPPPRPKLAEAAPRAAELTRDPTPDRPRFTKKTPVETPWEPTKRERTMAAPAAGQPSAPAPAPVPMPLPVRQTVQQWPPPDQTDSDVTRHRTTESSAELKQTQLKRPAWPPAPAAEPSLSAAPAAHTSKTQQQQTSWIQRQTMETSAVAARPRAGVPAGPAGGVSPGSATAARRAGVPQSPVGQGPAPFVQQSAGYSKVERRVESSSCERRQQVVERVDSAGPGPSAVRLPSPMSPRQAPSSRVLSPRPSAEGVSMQKMWSTKKSEKLAKIWPPPSSDDDRPAAPVWTQDERDRPSSALSLGSNLEERAYESTGYTSDFAGYASEPELAALAARRPDPYIQQKILPQLKPQPQPPQLSQQQVSQQQQQSRTVWQQQQSSSMQRVTQQQQQQQQTAVGRPPQAQTVFRPVRPSPSPQRQLGPPAGTSMTSVTTRQEFHSSRQVVQQSSGPRLPGAVGVFPHQSPRPARPIRPKSPLVLQAAPPARPPSAPGPAPTVAALRPASATPTSAAFEPFPALPPFPYRADEPRARPPRGPPPRMPSKFRKGEMRESDYESDYEGRIPACWRPQDSGDEEPQYRAVRPPVPSPGPAAPAATEDSSDVMGIPLARPPPPVTPPRSPPAVRRSPPAVRRSPPPPRPVREPDSGYTADAENTIRRQRTSLYSETADAAFQSQRPADGDEPRSESPLSVSSFPEQSGEAAALPARQVRPLSLLARRVLARLARLVRRRR